MTNTDTDLAAARAFFAAIPSDTLFAMLVGGTYGGDLSTPRTCEQVDRDYSATFAAWRPRMDEQTAIALIAEAAKRGFDITLAA